jgi:hypothetical protein
MLVVSFLSLSSSFSGSGSSSDGVSGIRSSLVFSGLESSVESIACFQVSNQFLACLSVSEFLEITTTGFSAVELTPLEPNRSFDPKLINPYLPLVTKV